MIAIVATSAKGNGGNGSAYSVCPCRHNSKAMAELWQRQKKAIAIAIVNYCK